MEPLSSEMMSYDKKLDYTLYLNKYIKQHYSQLTKEQAYRVGYLGEYDIHSDGSLIAYSTEDSKAYKMFKYKYSNSNRVVLRYSGNFPLKPSKDVISNCSLVVGVVDSLYLHMSAVNNILTANNRNKAAFYDVFIDEKDGYYTIRHIVRTHQGAVYILNEDLVLIQAYYTQPFYSNFKSLDVEKSKIAMLFFTLYMYDEQLKEIIDNTNLVIETFTVEQMQQYIDINEMVHY